MRYLGGKARLAKYLVPYIHAELAKPGVTAYYEPFMGGGNVFCAVQTPLPKYGSDLHPELMALWKYVQSGAPLPTVVTETDYAIARRGGGLAWWRGFIGFGCSFGGKWMGGFARGGHGAYASTTARVLHRQRSGLINASLTCRPYDAYTPRRAVIYCDPPYEATTRYAQGNFDHARFWAWCRRMAVENVVLVSEYTGGRAVHRLVAEEVGVAHY